MLLTYRIVWFEDQIDNIRPFIDRIANQVSRLGFTPHIDLRAVVAGGTDPMLNLPSPRDVDLVMMDWKLGGGYDGAELAKKLRVVYRDAEMIFYSSESAKQLRKLIFDQDIDGVFCSHRTNLSERTMGIVHAQLRKILDLNHMRGIVMAATSDLDQAIIECLKKVHALSKQDTKDEFANTIGSKISKSLRSKADDIDKLVKKGNLDKLLHEPSFGAALRLSILQEEISKIEHQISETHLLEGLARYKDEVIGPRNDFAHRRAILEAGKLVLEGRSEPFNQESMIALRLKLLNHFDNLTGLISLLVEMAGGAGAEPINPLDYTEESLADALEGPTV
jgi:DNA-binding NarL/FixJ family response regulator